MKNLVAFICGLLFAVGLGVSGMTLPEKVLNFLDLFGDWDASLAFVMGAALLVHGASYKFIRKRPTPILSPDWHVPNKKEITPQLVLGSILFGMGWGLGGYCPGPALTSIVSGRLELFYFLGAMILGMLLYRAFEKRIPWPK